MLSVPTVAGIARHWCKLAGTGWQRWSQRLLALPRRTFTLLMLGALLFTRLGLFLLVFAVLRCPAQGDVARYYYPAACNVLHGLLPNHDFTSSYAPLFSYVSALPVCCWHSPLSIILFTILLELCALYFWIALAEETFGKIISCQAALLYVFNPLSLVNTAVFGANQVWLALLLAISLAVLYKRRALLSGIMLGAGLVMVKALAVLCVPAMLAATVEKKKWLAGFLLPVLSVTGICLLLHIDVLAPLSIESLRYTSGNLPYLFSLAGIDNTMGSVHLLSYLLLACLLVIMFLLAYQKNLCADKRSSIHLISLTMVLFMLVSCKSFTTYLLLALFPICLSLCALRTSRWMPLLFIVWSTVALCEPSIWIRLVKKADFRLLTFHQTFTGVSVPVMLLFLAVEMVLIGGYLWFGWRLWQYGLGTKVEMSTSANTAVTASL